MMLPLSLMMKLREMSSMVKWDRNGENILLIKNIIKIRKLPHVKKHTKFVLPGIYYNSTTVFRSKIFFFIISFEQS